MDGKFNNDLFNYDKLLLLRSLVKGNRNYDDIIFIMIVIKYY